MNLLYLYSIKFDDTLKANGHGCIWFGLIWFYGISIIVGYLMPNPFLYIKTVLYQKIQFNISRNLKSPKQFYFKQFILASIHCLVLFNP